MKKGKRELFATKSKIPQRKLNYTQKEWIYFALAILGILLIILIGGSQSHTGASIITNSQSNDFAGISSNNYGVSASLSACGSVTESSVLTTDVSSATTCFVITANNLVLDCAGYKISYNSGATNNNYGISATGRNNVTIKNCVIQDTSATGQYGNGVYFS